MFADALKDSMLGALYFVKIRCLKLKDLKIKGQ